MSRLGGVGAKLYRGEGFEGVLDRARYTELCRDLLERVRGVANDVATELAKPKYRSAHPGVFDGGMAGCDILLVGGETRVPSVLIYLNAFQYNEVGVAAAVAVLLTAIIFAMAFVITRVGERGAT